jgi:hypothetical protein
MSKSNNLSNIKENTNKINYDDIELDYGESSSSNNNNNNNNNCYNNNSNISLQLGDIIQIHDPTNEILNNNIFYIDYIDNNTIRLIDEKDLKPIELKIKDNIIGDGNIVGIDLLNRNENVGYARQNNLLPGEWINVYFGGDIPVIITGEITNLEEDMIELKLFNPDNENEDDIIYLNFDYKGLPLDLPIENIEIRPPPTSYKKKIKNVNQEQEDQEKEQDQDQDQDQDQEKEQEQEQNVFIKGNDNTLLKLKQNILEADQIEFGDYLNPIEEFIDIDKDKYRYNINAQTNDLLDELLSTIPANQRTNTVLNNIHTMITRFLQLREIGSVFDKNNNVESIVIKTANDKPLADYISQFKNKLYWILIVAQNIKKVYNVEEVDLSDIINSNIFDSLHNIENSFQNFKSNLSNDSINRYSNLYNSINEDMTPFISFPKEKSNNVIYEQEVNTDMNVLINNLGEIYSSTAKNSHVQNQRFVIQRYNLGLNRLQTTNMKGSNMIAKSINLTKNDMLSVNSILTLPEPAVKFSQINLPGSSILTKSNLNLSFLNYWELLKKNTIVKTVEIDDLNTELNYDSDNFIDNIKNYLLKIQLDQEPSKEIYKKFLDIIIPKIRVLFNMVKKYIKGKLSMVNLVSYLEPFLIYPNDLTYMQYIEINKFIKEKISEYNKNLIENSRKMAILKNIPSPKNFTSILLDLLDNPNEIKQIVLEKYGFDNKEVVKSNSEILKTMILSDFGNLYNTAIAFDNISLMFPNELNSIFETDKDKLNKTLDNDNETNKCKKYVIAKKYYSKDELQMDNGKILYFDKEYDTTPYNLLDNFQKEQNSLSAEDFIVFISDKLQKKFKYRLEDAEYTSESLVNGYKRLKDGQYSLLIDESNKNEMQYFMRKNNIWIEDNNIDKNLFLSDNESLCLVQPDCLYTDNENNDNDEKCESLVLNKDTIVSKALKEILDQFDKKYEITKEDLTNKLNKYLERYILIFDKLKTIHKFNLYKYNNIQYDIGLLVNESINVVISPYRHVRDLILGQSDFIKKQTDIIQFCSRFTRYFKENAADIQDGELESKYWLYCKDTNTKLMPAFLYTLAKVIIQNPNVYDNTINNIVKDQGALSDDGENWVDKYSGYVIRAIDWDIEEGYDEGFKIISREVLEKDLGQTVLEKSKLTKKFINPQAQSINNIVSSLSSYMGIQLDDQMEFIIKIVTNLINDSNIMENENTYNKRIEEMAKKGKKLPDYKIVYNSAFLYLTLGMYLISIQTSIPSIRSRKTFPGCVRSFTGFPLQGEGEYSGLNYLACIVNKLKSPSAPWFVLQKVKEDKIAEKIKSFIIQYLLSNQEVIQKMKMKSEYILLNPEEEIPLEHSLLKWTNFLPPLVKFKIKGLQNVGDGYMDLLLKDIKSGSIKQNEKLLVIESKIIQFSLAIQEFIQKIIEKKELLLKNSIHPYMDNACCNEPNKGNITYTTLDYFINENKEIGQYNRIIIQLSNIITDVRSLTESAMYLSSIDTKRFYPPLPSSYTENTIYQTFIKYCNFNNFLPIETDLLLLCKDKPEYLNINDSIEEKIRKLKRDGRNYTEDGMLRLIQIVSRHNIVEREVDLKYHTLIQRLRDLLESLDKNNDDNIAKSFINLLNNSLDTYDITVTQDTENMRKMKNYLEISNNKMRKQILDFIKEKGKIKENEYKKTVNFIINISNWDFDNSKRNEENKISDDGMYNYIQYFKTFIYMLSKVFPNMIINKAFHSINIPKYWGLSKNHAKEIKKMVEGFYVPIEKFFGKSSLNNILIQIQEKCKSINLLSEETPALTSIKDEKGKEIYSVFDKRTSTLLYEYYILQVFASYIDLTDNPLMIKRIIPSVINNKDDIFAEEEEEKLETVEPDYISGDMNELKGLVANLLIGYIKIMNETKKTINISYDKVTDRVFKLREKEKDTFTDRLKELTDESREVENILKINKLGVWNKGLLKGLKEYDPENYDQEKVVMQKVTELEKKIRRENDNIDDDNMDIIVDEYLEDMEANEYEENEELAMNNMSEDYMDGYDYNEKEDEDIREYD